MANNNQDTFVDRLTTILVQKKMIASKEGVNIKKAFQEAEQAQFDVFLLEEGLVEADDLLEALSEFYHVPAFDVIDYFFDTFELRKFPKDFLLRHAVIPLEVDENMLVMVASEPEKPGLESEIREYVSYDIVFNVGLRRDICNAIKEFYDEAPTEVKHDEDLREGRQEARLEQAQELSEEEPWDEEEEEILTEETEKLTEEEEDLGTNQDKKDAW